LSEAAAKTLEGALSGSSYTNRLTSNIVEVHVPLFYDAA
jgi:hypothetical protein